MLIKSAFFHGCFSIQLKVNRSIIIKSYNKEGWIKVRTLKTLIVSIYLVLRSVPRLKKIQKMDKKNYGREEYNEIVHKRPKKIGRKIFKSTGSKIVVNGEDKLCDSQVLFVSNHQGNFDIFALLGFLKKPFGFISKIEVKKIPIARTWMEKMDCLFLDRKDRRQSLKTFKQGIELLKEGHSLLIFPEGTRARSDELLEFKSGSLSLAKKANVPIQPVMVNGTYNIMEVNNNRIRKGKVYLTVCDPIMPEEYENLSLDELADETKKRIQEAMDQTTA